MLSKCAIPGKNLPTLFLGLFYSGTVTTWGPLVAGSLNAASLEAITDSRSPIKQGKEQKE
jgi:hypothetical protein